MQIQTTHGYVYAHRRVWTHPAFNDLREAAIFNFLYQNAFYEDGLRQFKGQTVELKRGQIIVSMSFLAEGFHMSEKGVRGVILKLEKYGMLVKQRANRGTILTICNYDKYQKIIQTEGEQEGNQRANRGQSEGDNNNKDNKNNKYKEYKEASSDASRKKGCRLPDDWILSEELGYWSMRQGLKREEVFDQYDKFVDYWKAVPGQKGVKLDWDATFRNWIRRAVSNV